MSSFPIPAGFPFSHDGTMSTYEKKQQKIPALPGAV